MKIYFENNIIYIHRYFTTYIFDFKICFNLTILLIIMYLCPGNF